MKIKKHDKKKKYRFSTKLLLLQQIVRMHKPVPINVFIYVYTTQGKITYKFFWISSLTHGLLLCTHFKANSQHSPWFFLVRNFNTVNCVTQKRRHWFKITASLNKVHCTIYLIVTILFGGVFLSCHFELFYFDFSLFERVSFKSMHSLPDARSLKEIGQQRIPTI